MQFRLQTLLIWGAIGPPLLAALWIYVPVVRAALATFTPRDGLWLALLLGFATGFWINHRRSAKRIAVLADKITRFRS